MSPFMYDVKMGAFTLLWSGLSADIKLEDGGQFVIPWGRWYSGMSQELTASFTEKEQGGTGIAEEFWEWCENQVQPYV